MSAKLLNAIIWKHPGINGVRIEDGVITDYPDNFPPVNDTGILLAQYDTYLTNPARQDEEADDKIDNSAKNFRALMLALADELNIPYGQLVASVKTKYKTL